MHLSSLNAARWLLAGLAAALIPACDDSEPDHEGLTIPEEAEIRAAFAAWTPSVLKECSVAAAFFPDEPRDEDDPVRTHLDGAAALAKLDGELRLRGAGGEIVVLGAPQRTGRSGFSNRDLTVRTDGGDRRTMSLGADLDFDGTCVITIDDAEVYRGTLWGSLPIVAHARPATGELARRTSAANLYVGRDVTYAELPGLHAVAAALAPDLPRAEALLATTLGISAAEAANRLVAPPLVLPYIEAGGARAPFAIIQHGASNDGIPFLHDPIVPVKDGHLERWAPATGSVAHTLRVLLPRPALSVAGYQEGPDRPLALDLLVSIEAAPGGQQAVVVTGVSGTRSLEGSRAAATRCVQSVAETALAYARAPELGVTVPRFPIALLPNSAPAASAAWITVPCAVWSGDLVAALRETPDLVGALLDVRSYATGQVASSPALRSRGWDGVMAVLAADTASLDALERAMPSHPLVVGVARSVRGLLGDARYTASSAEDRRDMRTLVWHVGMLCGRELTDPERGALLAAVEDGDYLALRDDLLQCPF